eukprot:scaffold352_cov203-Chaetoceros_neogracile.AAC.3
MAWVPCVGRGFSPNYPRELPAKMTKNQGTGCTDLRTIADEIDQIDEFGRNFPSIDMAIFIQRQWLMWRLEAWLTFCVE